MFFFEKIQNNIRPWLYIKLDTPFLDVREPTVCIRIRDRQYLCIWEYKNATLAAAVDKSMGSISNSSIANDQDKEGINDHHQED